MDKQPLKLAKKISHKLNDMRGEAYAYELDPPIKDEPWDDSEPQEYKYVVVSAVRVLGVPETYIFPARKAGDVVVIADYSELPGSYRGGLDHNEALRGAGYAVIK